MQEYQYLNFDNFVGYGFHARSPRIEIVGISDTFRTCIYVRKSLHFMSSKSRRLLILILLSPLLILIFILIIIDEVVLNTGL